MNIIDLNQLSSVRAKHAGQKIIFCSGCFDLTHPGHVLFFEDCKKYGDILVVMVGNDFNLRGYKGSGRPVLNQHIRLKMVSSLKPVDYAFLDLNAKDNDLLAINTFVFENLQPDYYIINKDAFDIPRRYDLIRDYNVEMIILDRTCPPEFENISTTQIIEKIKKEPAQP